MADLTAWWNTLSPATQERLIEDPYAPVPPDLWLEVIRGDVYVAGGWFLSVSEGPDGYYLPTGVSEFIEEQQRG